MAAKRSLKKVLRNCNLILTSTIFENAGDFVTSTVDNADDLLVTAKYTRRHINFSGEFVLSFPGTEEPDEPAPLAHVFPSKEFYDLKDGKFTVTATKAGSQYYCIIPGYITQQIESKQYVIFQNETKILEKNRLYFIYNTGPTYLLNDVEQTAKKILACEESSATLIASGGDIRLFEFYIPNTSL